VVARYDWSDPTVVRWTVEESCPGGHGTGSVRIAWGARGVAVGFSAGVGALALVLVGLAAMAAASVATLHWVRLSALAMPVLMSSG
jgi:hypothetical protein